MSFPRTRSALAGLLLALAGCSGDHPVAPSQPLPPPPFPPEQPSSVAPHVTSAGIAANPNNVLSAVLTFAAERADSARVLFLDQGAIADSTPFEPIVNGSGSIVTLGLRPATSYRNVLEIAGAGGRAASDTLPFTTGQPPDLLRRVSIHTTGNAGPGLTLAALQVGGNDVFAVAFDSEGQIRWYRRFAGNDPVGGELKQQSNGDFTIYRGTSHGSQRVPGSYVELTPAGDSVRAVSQTAPRYVDNHEFWITPGPDGQERFHFFSYDYRSVVLDSGGSRRPLAGHQLLRLRADGSAEFEWSSWDHFSLKDWIEPRPKTLPEEFDFDHPNSIDLDEQGNYVVSFRRLSQIVKLDATTAEIRWRLGGRRSDFTILGDPLGGFTFQHSARLLPNDHLLLYDNGGGHTPPESRAVEYALDTTAMTATMVWEFRHHPVIYTPGSGAVQRLRSGNTLIAYGQKGRANEVTPDGEVVWEAEVSVDGKPPSIYRLVRIVSLYRYLTP
jgi:Arylsulfotransferase (ASST)